ncbi:phosphodiester glycosidase family protein [Tepidibacter hydrothermalis]|uniref:Phosphodiester glycosidase family protein n=1 Tax=Tepidibacter hydrothermalis TaxID=3036126 RepID=A0ABY8EH60_9FIRM|nr:phosphodiester glycosidase family protein [Tepidibacter hydrothermalis]WFD12266.1 phosphodiester glycosidase family protein [Tepidibacter hydrothermalis]
MKKIFLITFMIVCISVMQVCAFSPYVSYNQHFKSVNKTAKIVLIDMNNQTIKPKVARAHEKIASADSLKHMTDSKKTDSNRVIGGINGTYFSAYDGSNLPYGTLIEDGKVVHVGNYGSVMGFTADNKMIIDNLNITIDGYINDEKQFYAWGLNHPRTEKDAIVVYTEEYGEAISAKTGKAIMVENGVVKYIVENKDNLWASKNGLIIVFNEEVAYLADRFKVGDIVSYKCNFESKNIDQTIEGNVQWDDVTCAIGAGPSLIIDGKITANGAQEGFWESKINTSRAQRSFIGYTYENKLVMGTVSNANLKELAQICKEMNLKGAMCMDGGASSSLYYQGKYITAPGRNINNALVFTEEIVNQ